MSNIEEWDPDAGANGDSGQRRLPPSSTSASLSQESASGQRRRRRQDDDALSRHSANLSVAELSRMEETVLSQASHHEEENERQRKRLERKARRDSGIKAKRIVKPPTEIQLERRRGYSRFKYKKKADLVDEGDVGGSMEYHARKILGSRAERRRLESVARAREGADRMIEENAMEGGGSGDALGSRRKRTNRGVKSSGDDEVNWNFLEMGYTTMPSGDAAKLPYYIHGKSKKQGRHPVPEIDATSSESIPGTNRDTDAGRSRKRQKTDQFLFPEEGAVASSGTGGSKRPRRTATSFAIEHPTPAPEQCNVVFPRSFPLRFHQSKKRMDLHGMNYTITSGSERMVFAHGRNATRLWIRMVASGVMTRDFDVPSPRANETDVVDQTHPKNEDDSISNVSASSFSSKSSVRSYQPLGVFSQVSYGNTSVIAMENVDDNESAASSVSDARKTPLFLLMSMVHSLPKFTHRHRFLIQVARELGANRRWWDDELKCLVECANDESDEKEGGILTPRKRREIMLFLGVDGRATEPPGWTSDPLMPTHPEVLKQRVHYMRIKLEKDLRHWMQKRKKFDPISPTEALVESTLSSNGRIRDVPIIEHAESKWANSSVKIEEGEGDMQHRASESELADDGERESTRKVSGIHDRTSGITDEAANSEGVEKKLPRAKEEDGEHTASTDESRALMVSLIDVIQRSDPGGVDKYSFVTHESQIEASHVDVALASFMDHLTSSMARLRQKQQLNSSDFLYRRSLRLLKEEVGFWHETIDSYLNLATSLTEVPDVNFFKSSGVFPESAARAKAIMAAQSYLANGGAVGCGRKRWKSKLSSWEAKEENNSSDDSDASDLDNIDHTSANLQREELHSIKLAAMEIAKRGKERDKKSTKFTRVHVTTGIAMIVEVLTPLAAELLSRQPCPDAADNRTPFELMSNMLSLVEEKSSLISLPQLVWEARDKIIDDIVVKTMLEAAMMFRRCIVNEPEDVDHWSWYVATLLGMLCIAFGTSERQQLDSYSTIRSCAAVAVKDFVSFSQSYDCAMFHLAVSSMLEWKKPILLLHCPPQVIGSKYGFGLEVNYLHAYHTYCWAKKVCSRASIEKVHVLFESNYLPRDSLLDVLASAIERDPCERANWARLVDALGTVKEENAARHLHSQEGRKKWWGTLRVTHWEDDFFHAPEITVEAVKSDFVDTVSSFVISHVAKAKHLAVQPDDSLSIPAPEDCLNWMWNPSKDGAGVTHTHDSLPDDELLPGKTSTSAIHSQRDLLFDSGINERIARHPNCEALCMKIVVASHLLGIQHKYVSDSIWWLAAKLWQSSQANEMIVTSSNNKNSYAEGLTWLSMYRIDTSACLLQRPRIEWSEK